MAGVAARPVPEGDAMDAYTIPDVIAKNAIGQPVNAGGIAFTFDGTATSYEELHDRATRLAHGMLAAGFAKGDRVAVLMRNRPEWIEVFFGVTRAGGVLVPLNYLLHAGEIDFILGDSSARWIVYEEPYAEVAAELQRRNPALRCVGVDEPAAAPLSYAGLLAARDDRRLPEVSPEDLALLQYTSGTTGQPKGAMHTHSTVLWNSYHQVSDFAVSHDDVCYVTPALCWAAGFHDLALATLWVGGRLVLTSSSFDPGQFLQAVERERVTTTLLVPTVLKRVLAAPGFGSCELSSLRMVISGGEPVPVTSIKEMRRRLPSCSVLQVYGLSEFPTLMLLLRPEDADRKHGSTGKACSIARVQVVDGEGKAVPPGQAGEIICKSPAVMRGYYGRPDATAVTLADGWLHTGDLATVDEEGYVFVAGRSKDMIITGGLNVYPAEVERVIAEHPAVIEAAVVGVPDEQWGEVGRAHVVLGEDRTLTGDDLGSWLRERLATFKVPRHYEFRSAALPRTTSGKVQKFMLSR